MPKPSQKPFQTPLAVTEAAGLVTSGTLPKHRIEKMLTPQGRKILEQQLAQPPVLTTRTDWRTQALNLSAKIARHHPLSPQERSLYAEFKRKHWPVDEWARRLAAGKR